MSSGAEDKRIDTATPAHDHVHRVMSGLGAASTVQAAVELEIFDALRDLPGASTSRQVAESKTYNVDATERLLNTLASLKLVDKIFTNGVGQFRANESGALLAKKHPSSLAFIISGFHQTMQHLTDVVKGKKSEPSDGHQGHEDMGYSLDLYKGIHNMLEPVAASLLTAFDLGCHKTVLDLGGGSGVLSYEFKRVYPAATVYLNDRPDVLEVAREHFYKGNEHLNIKFLPGDFKETELPSVDLIIMSQVLHHVDDQEKFLESLKKHLNPGGGILLVENVLEDNKVGPLVTNIWDLMMMDQPDSTMREFSAAEFRARLSKLGYRDVKVAKTQEYCLYDAIYARL